MSDSHVYPVMPSIAQKAHADEAKYQALYQQSITDPEGFGENKAR
jgi:acetyl-coenzyme A synthetase (EC 6.2.1.1)